MATPSAQFVAECLISLSHAKQNPVTNLKLQKLLYYSQAWHLALYKSPLFGEEIEAWVHGPVVPDVFRRFRDCRWNPIPSSGEGLTAPFLPHLEAVWKVYGELRAYDLERLTHSEEPWKMARGGLPPDVSSHRVISKPSMQEYYSSRLNG